MDIKPELLEKAEELAQKMKTDKNLAACFQSDPVRTLEQLLGRDLPDEKILTLSAAVKGRMAGLADTAAAEAEAAGQKLQHTNIKIAAHRGQHVGAQTTMAEKPQRMAIKTVSRSEMAEEAGEEEASGFLASVAKRAAMKKHKDK